MAFFAEESKSFTEIVAAGGGLLAAVGSDFIPHAIFVSSSIAGQINHAAPATAGSIHGANCGNFFALLSPVDAATAAEPKRGSGILAMIEGREESDMMVVFETVRSMRRVDVSLDLRYRYILHLCGIC